MEQPSPSVHRIMLSTTSRFTGEYESPDISVVHAWTDTFGRSRQMSVGLDENAHSRNYFVLSLDVENPLGSRGRCTRSPTTPTSANGSARR